MVTSAGDPVMRWRLGTALRDRTTSGARRRFSRTSAIDGEQCEGPMPSEIEAFMSASRSTRSTERPARAKDAARLTAVVVLPTPPWGLNAAMIIESADCPSRTVGD